MQIVQVLQPSYCSLQFARWETMVTIPPCMLPLTDFHSIYFIIVNSDAPIIARATQNGDPRAICRLPQKVASLEPPISNMDTHTYTHICMIFSAVFHICIIVQAF